MFDLCYSEKELSKIAEVDLPNYDGWIELNVTSTVMQWTADATSNKGFYIGAYLKSRPGETSKLFNTTENKNVIISDREIKLDEIGLVNARGDDKYQPFLVAYCRGPQVCKILHTLIIFITESFIAKVNQDKKKYFSEANQKC